MLGKACQAFAIVFALASFAAAQDEGRFDLSLGYGGVFSKTSTSSNGGVTLNPTNSGAFLATFRLRFNRMHGLEADLGYTKNSQTYFVPPDNFRVQASATEFSVAYVLNPFQAGRLEPFLFVGGGVLRFNPNSTYIDGFPSAIGAARQTSVAVLYGGGADCRVWKFLALRLQYRGLIYKEPDFHVPVLFTGSYGHMVEPSGGIVFKF
jgi:opacity protein-like surface antigen